MNEDYRSGGDALKPNEDLARALHALAFGCEFNDKPKKYFTLDTGKTLPKNTITIRRTGAYVTFFIKSQELLSEAEVEGITLHPVLTKNKPYNEDKYASNNLDLAKVKNKSHTITKLIRESIEIIESRKGRSSKGKVRK